MGVSFVALKDSAILFCPDYPPNNLWNGIPNFKGLFVESISIPTQKKLLIEFGMVLHMPSVAKNRLHNSLVVVVLVPRFYMG